MSTKCTLSFHMGSRFNEKHNNRTIPVPHADREYEKIHNWYHPNNMTLEQAYDVLFFKSFNEYNSSIRKDRQYHSYLEKLQIAQQKEQEKLSDLRHAGASASEIRKHRKAVKPAYEIIIGLGNMRDNPEFCKNGKMQDAAKEILLKYIEQFERKNKNVFLYNAAVHTGENGTIHLHADVIFWAKCSRGQKLQTSLTKALAAMGYISDKEKDANGKRLNAITKWENEQRRILRDLCKDMADITIVDGTHSRHHISTEEYQAQQDSMFIKKQAAALLTEQDKFINHVAHSNSETAYLERRENERLREIAVQYDAITQKNAKLLSDAWLDFNAITSSYFEEYRKKKKLLYDEIYRARQGAKDSRKLLSNILNDIAYSNDFFLFKLCKLIYALFIAIEKIYYDNQVEHLQQANTALKQQAKEIMMKSNTTSAILRTKELDDIEKALSNYEAAVKGAKLFVEKSTQEWKNTNSQETTR